MNMIMLQSTVALKYELVLCSHTLLELPSAAERLATLNKLWNRVEKVTSDLFCYLLNYVFIFIVVAGWLPGSGRERHQCRVPRDRRGPGLLGADLAAGRVRGRGSGGRSCGRRGSQRRAVLSRGRLPPPRSRHHSMQLPSQVIFLLYLHST